MGRPKEHDERTRAALRAATERLIAEGGVAAFSVRAVADQAGTTTRAVYSLFGSKDGLLVDAMAQGAFEYLTEGIDALTETADPVADLIAVGVPVFRSLVRGHPALYRIAFQRIVPGFRAGPEVTAARQQAWGRLTAKIQRLKDAGLLDHRPVGEAALEFNAMLEGLANAELRGRALSLLPEGGEEQAWRNALTTVIRGFSAGSQRRRPRSRPATEQPSGTGAAQHHTGTGTVRGGKIVAADVTRTR
jgi:AcrR family transcriptional regulator